MSILHLFVNVAVTAEQKQPGIAISVDMCGWTSYSVLWSTLSTYKVLNGCHATAGVGKVQRRAGQRVVHAKDQACISRLEGLLRLTLYISAELGDSRSAVKHLLVPVLEFW